mgnify:CR=1 FL=1
MKNAATNLKSKIISKYFEKAAPKNLSKSTDINILLNRVKLEKKRESRKKILFSTVASAGVLIFGVLIF